MVPNILPMLMKKIYIIVQNTPIEKLDQDALILLETLWEITNYQKWKESQKIVITQVEISKKQSNTQQHFILVSKNEKENHWLEKNIIRVWN